MKENFENFKLHNKVALITGAGGLLGIEHAKALLESGATVVLTDIDSNILHKAGKDLTNIYGKERVVCKTMDVTSEESIQNVSSNLISNNLFISILINNAAIDPKVNKDSIVETSRLENFSLEDWDFQLKVGLTGAMLCSKIFGSRMANNGGGVILNIASDLSVFAPDQRLYKKNDLPWNEQPVKPVTYSVIKHGLIGLTKYITTYWAKDGIRANTLCPAGVYTNQPESFVNKISQLIPMGRMARKDEYKAAILFLASDASSYMNGQTLIIDGGRSIL